MSNACGKGYTFSQFIRYHGLLLLERLEHGLYEPEHYGTLVYKIIQSH